MKVEINNENKAKFFVHYWGQEVLRSLTNNGIFNLYRVGFDNNYYNELDYLELKCLSDISDEDLEYLAEIHLGKKPNMVNIDSTPDKSFFTIEYSNQKCEFNENYDRISMYLQISDGVINNVWGYENSKGTGVSYERIDSLPMYDYLRSRGYLVPWMGLSCEELIEDGWVKLIK